MSPASDTNQRLKADAVGADVSRGAVVEQAGAGHWPGSGAAGASPREVAEVDRQELQAPGGLHLAEVAEHQSAAGVGGAVQAVHAFP